MLFILLYRAEGKAFCVMAKADTGFGDAPLTFSKPRIVGRWGGVPRSGEHDPVARGQ